MSRLQPVDPATLSPESRAVYDKIANLHFLHNASPKFSRVV